MELNKILKFVFFTNPQSTGTKVTIVKAYADVDDSLYELAYGFVKKDVDNIVTKFSQIGKQAALMEQLKYMLLKRDGDFNKYLEERQKKLNNSFTSGRAY